MKKRNIVFAGYEFTAGIQRGIYLYTKSLLEATKTLGHDTSILTSTPHVGNLDDSSLVHIYRSLRDPGRWGFSPSLRKAMVRYFSYRILQKKKDIFLKNSDRIITEENQWFLKSVDSFINVPGIYRISNVKERLSFEKPLDLGFLEKHGIDTVFTTSPFPACSRASRVKIVQTLHDLIPLNLAVLDENPTIFLRRIRALANQADRILAVSEYSRNQLIDLFPQAESRIDVVYQPIPANDYILSLSALPEVQEAALTKYGLKSGQYSFYIGAIEARKNIHRMIEAYRLASKHTDQPLVLAGSVDDKYVKEHGHGSLFAKPRKSREGKKLVYLGYVTEIEKLCLMRHARMFLFPTLFEGFGIPVLEAQTMGCPVLTTNASSLPEVVGQSAAMIQDPFNVEELANVIGRLMDDDTERARLSDAGLVNAQRFSKQQFADGLAGLLSRLH